MGQSTLQLIRVADQQVPLPPGVTVTAWSLEKVRCQNPRIRAFLGCIRLLGGVLESNYAILHCSPERLREIWRKVRQVAELVRKRVAPLLEEASVIPALEETRRGARESLEMLERDALSPLDRFPDTVASDQLLEVRKLLCVSIGKIHAFLQDTFGQLMASDPRSLHDADYFLSQRFPQDIEEAEWLHATVERLDGTMAELDRRRAEVLAPLLARLGSDSRLPEREKWEAVRGLLESCVAGLTPKLTETLALRGIRFYEMEILDRYAVEVPTRCRIAGELYEHAAEVIERLQAVAGNGSGNGSGDAVREGERHCHAVTARRLEDVLGEVDRALRDLRAFLPLWLEGIERRRAMMLRRGGDALDGGADVDVDEG